MKAAVFEAINEVNIREVPIPEVKKGWALVKVKAAGLCITDVHVIKGLFAHAEPPCIQGHEVAGEVIKIGETDWPAKVQVGDRVVIETMIACGECEQCLNGFKNLCDYGQDIGETRYQGGYAEYVAVPISCLYKIPDNMSYEEAAIFESFVCPVGGLQRLGITQADTVLVQGPGPAGLAFVQAARVMGAKKIIVSGRGGKKQELAKKYGADVVVNVKEENLAEVVDRETNGRGADVSIEASGAEKCIEQSLDFCKKNGKVILYGIPGDDHNIRFDVTQIIMKQLNVFGTSGVPWAWGRTLELYGQGKYNIKDMVTHTFPLEKINEAIDTLLDKSSEAIKIVLIP